MVVFSQSIIPVAQRCPVPQSSIHPYPGLVCSIPAIPCQPTYAQQPVMQGASLVTAPSQIPSHSVVPYTGNLNASHPMTAIVPCNLPPSSVMSYDPAIPPTQMMTYTTQPASSLACTQVIAGNGTSAMYTTPVISTNITYAPAYCPVSPPLPSTHIIGTPTKQPLNVPLLHDFLKRFHTPTTTWNQAYGMEHVWKSEFHQFFSLYLPQTWLLEYTEDPPKLEWELFVDSAKVRFSCESCGHGWTSMKGRAMFWFMLSTCGEGAVLVRLFGQQCDRCKSGKYENAMWYPEEVSKVLVNLYHRVGQVYYGFQQPPINKTRRPGKPRTPHNSELCQACQDGLCSERK